MATPACLLEERVLSQVTSLDRIIGTDTNSCAVCDSGQYWLRRLKPHVLGSGTTRVVVLAGDLSQSIIIQCTHSGWQQGTQYKLRKPLCVYGLTLPEDNVGPTRTTCQRLEQRL